MWNVVHRSVVEHNSFHDLLGVSVWKVGDALIHLRLDRIFGHPRDNENESATWD